MDIKTIPKLDLHCHLDGSLTKAMMERHLGKTIPEDALTVSEDCTSLTEYLEKFDLPVQCLQDEAGLEDGAYTFVEEIAKEHVEYIEVRFAPMLSVHENLSCAKVIESVRKGMERAKADFQVQYGIIVCAMRNHSQEQNLSMLKCAREYLGHPHSRPRDSATFLWKQNVWACRLPFIPGKPEIWKMSGKPTNWGQGGSATASHFKKIRS